MVYVQLKETWFPVRGFAAKPTDGDPEKGHKVKTHPVKSLWHNRSHWLTNDEPEEKDS